MDNSSYQPRTLRQKQTKKIKIFIEIIPLEKAWITASLCIIKKNLNLYQII